MILALQMQTVIIQWRIYEITKDKFSLGLIGLCEAIPFITVALFAGHIADIVKRKTIIISVAVVLFIASLALYFLSIDQSLFNFQDKTFPIYAVIFITGIARGFIGPALFAFMPQIVKDKSLYANAISWNSSIWQAGSVVGPSLAGVIYLIGGAQVVYFLISLLLAASLILFSLIATKPVPPSNEELGVMERLTAGIKFVFNNELILSAITLDLFAVLFGGAVALLPVYAAEILNVGATGLGFLRAAPGIGAVITLIFLVYSPIKKNAGRKMLLAVTGFGLCIILFGISTNFWVSMLLLTLSGAFDSISVIVRSTLIHHHTPEHMKGRVSSVNNIFIGSSNEIGSFESGTLAEAIGTVPSVVAGGIATMVIVGFTAMKAKKLRDLDL